MRLSQRLALIYVRTKFKLLSSLSPRKAAEKAFTLFCTPQHRNLKNLPPIFEKAEKIKFNFQQYTISGYRWNHGAGKKVLIAHGFESSVVNFDHFVNPLINKGYEVLAFDAPAHGRSTGKTLNAVIYQEFLTYIYEHYGPIQSFITHSFGGLCLSLALENLPHTKDHKVVFVAPAVETATAIDNFFGLLKLDAGIRKEFDQLIFEIGGHYPEWYSLSRIAPRIRAQVLFLQDKDDHMTPLKDVEPIMKNKYPNFQFVISEGLGHRRIYRDQGSAKTIIDFL
ncbi:MAG TPA: alpha/beta fold hydrolase [Flavisolibacter sp.]